MDFLFSVVSVAGVVALIVFLSKQTARSREAAAQAAQESLRPYHEAYSKALSSDDPEKVMITGNGLVEATRYWKSSDVPQVAEGVYRDSLKLLKEHPGIKPFVLSMGRLAYGSKRLGGAATIYDEQAIMNDISAYT